MSALDFEDTIFLGDESHRPIRHGDDLQVGSNWTPPSKPRRQRAAERLQRDRDARFIELGHRVAIWTMAPVGAVLAIYAGVVIGPTLLHYAAWAIVTLAEAAR